MFALKILSLSQSGRTMAVVGLFGLAACGTEDGDTSVHVATRDSAGVAIVEISGNVEDLPEWELASTPSVRIDGSEPPYFSSIGEVEWLSDGRIVVEDNYPALLHLFSEDGSYVRQLGDTGDGPGQFQNITEMTVVTGDSVYLYDRRHRRLSVVHPDGGFVRSITYADNLGGRPPLDVFALSEDRLLVQASSRGDVEEGTLPRLNPRDAQLFLTAADGSLLRGPVVFPGSIEALGEGLSASPLYSYRALVAVGGGNDWFVHGSGEHYDLTVRDQDLEASRMIRWDGWGGPIPEAEFEVLYQQFLDRASELPAQIRDQYEEAIFASHMQPERRPALSWRSYVDDTGRIWLSAFEPAGLPDEPRRWHVLSPAGSPLARLSLPPGSTLVAIASDRIMLMTPDEFDVESLFVYQIQR